jgi:predicted nucleic acid-binding protein
LLIVAGKGRVIVEKLKIYLDTSAIGYLDERTSPTEMNDMLVLWGRIKRGDYDVVISQIALNEIRDNKNAEKVKTLVVFLSEISYATIEVDDEIERIAAQVQSNGLLVSDKHRNDRLHIGCAIASGCDVLVSLNFKHLVNVKTVKGVREIASLGGYRHIDIVPPNMLIQEDGE